MFSWYGFQISLIILVAPIVTSMIIHFKFHTNSCILTAYNTTKDALVFYFLFCILLHCISIHWYYHIYQYVYFLFFVFNYYVWPIFLNFCLYVPFLSIKLSHLRVYILVFVCVCVYMYRSSCCSYAWYSA